MKLNQLPAGWKHSTRLTVKEWANEYVIGKLLIWKSILRVLACKGKGMGKGTNIYGVPRGSDGGNSFISGSLQALFSFIFSEMYWIKITTTPTSPPPCLILVEKAWREILSWDQDPGDIWRTGVRFSVFPLSRLLFVDGWNVEQCCPTFSKRHVNNPVISVMYSVMGVIKSFSFEVRPSFWKVADEGSRIYAEEAAVPGLFGSSGGAGRKYLRKLKWTILKIPEFQGTFS